jgi:hypothetical protein
MSLEESEENCNKSRKNVWRGGKEVGEMELCTEITRESDSLETNCGRRASEENVVKLTLMRNLLGVSVCIFPDYQANDSTGDVTRDLYKNTLRSYS